MAAHQMFPKDNLALHDNMATYQLALYQLSRLSYMAIWQYVNWPATNYPTGQGSQFLVHGTYASAVISLKLRVANMLGYHTNDLQF